VKQIIINNEIDVLCIQETEIEANIGHKLMSFENYNFESENNQKKSYINFNLNYVRKSELEGVNNHLVIDIKLTNNMRLINIYRPFNLSNDVTPRQFFENQLNLIRAAYISNTLLMGDFSSDWNKRYVHLYAFKNYFFDMERVLYNVPHIQLINFPTWS
jgi:exonuclease III